jgi:hypothetical protein
MFCNKCKRVYDSDVSNCPECGSPLSERAHIREDGSYAELVTVLSTGDLSLIAIAKSILEDAGIRYFVKGESLHRLFGLGRASYNPAAGPVQIQVSTQDEEVARELLKADGE